METAIEETDETVHPLAPPPPRSAALALFLRHFGIDLSGSDRSAPSTALLEDMTRAFARIPYENLTKVLKLHREGSPARARRGPREVVAEHVSLGAGGTCFSLTAALLHLLRALGWRAEPLLADRRYGPDTHCALAVWLDGAPHLVDPGFLLTRPVPLRTSGETAVETSFNRIVLTPRDGGERIDLHTVDTIHAVHGAAHGAAHGARRTYRLTFRASPADPAAFLRAWDASFGWDMMRYPVLTRVEEAGQVYLQGRRLQVRSRGAVRRSELAAEDLPARIGEFGLDPEVGARALDVLRRQGEL